MTYSGDTHGANWDQTCVGKIAKDYIVL